MSEYTDSVEQNLRGLDKGCGVCGTHLGGTVEVWHAFDSDGALLHFTDACVDCVLEQHEFWTAPCGFDDPKWELAPS